MSTVRKGPACVVYHNRVYVIGGLKQNLALASTELFDLSTRKWEAGPDLPRAVGSQARAFVYQDTLYVLDLQGTFYKLDTDGQWVILSEGEESAEKSVRPVLIVSKETLHC